MDDTTEEMANNTVLPEIQYRADFIGKSSFFIRSQFLHPFQLTLHLQQKAIGNARENICKEKLRTQDLLVQVIVKENITSTRLSFTANKVNLQKLKMTKTKLVRAATPASCYLGS